VVLGTTAYATLYFTGYLDDAARVLDHAAVTFGESTISPLTILKAAVATGLLFIGARSLTGNLGARIRANQGLSPSLRVLAVKILQVVLYSAALFIGLKAVGFDLTGLAFLSGAGGVGQGFGLQRWCRTSCRASSSCSTNR
jgi:small-conductance mechanosensitive channel